VKAGEVDLARDLEGRFVKAGEVDLAAKVLFYLVVFCFFLFYLSLFYFYLFCFEGIW